MLETRFRKGGSFGIDESLGLEKHPQVEQFTNKFNREKNWSICQRPLIPDHVKEKISPPPLEGFLVSLVAKNCPRLLFF